LKIKFHRIFKKSLFEYAHIFKRDGKKKQTVKVILTDSKLTPRNLSTGKFFTETGADRDIKIMIGRAVARLNRHGYTPFFNND